MSSDGKRGWLGLLLFVSVAANLFLGGLMLGRAVFAPVNWEAAALDAGPAEAPSNMGAPGGNAPEIRMAASANRLAERVRALPQAERRRFFTVLRQNRGDLPEARMALRRAVAHVGQVIAAPTLDQQALTAAFADVRTATEREQASLHAALVPALAALSAESRVSLVSGGLPRKSP
jgi:uncharacterized membrane protein